jgi:DNA polymerase delta subunit 1
MRHAGQHGLVIPVFDSQGTDDQYEGATVIEPKKGALHRCPARLE